MQGGQDKSLAHLDFEIFAVSALILYLELVLIRWIGTEIRIFAYLGNLILVAGFFGSGLGCYWSGRPIRLAHFSIGLLLLTGFVANPLHREWLDFKKLTVWLAGIEELPMGSLFVASHGQIAVALAAIGGLVSLVIWLFIPAGQILGRALGTHPQTIRAYSVNIAGSLSGIWLFTALSWCRAAPVEWFAILAGLAIVVAAASGGRPWWRLLIPVGIATGFVWLGQPHGVRTIWSPYQKLEVYPYVPEDATKWKAPAGAIYILTANGIGYQLMVNLSDQFLRSHPESYRLEQACLSHYNLAFQFKPKIQRLLILGAGAGNNAAAALRHGVAEVDCVDIDPEIYALGKELHPEQPYQSPRVHMAVTDARAFLRSAEGPYDMIWFGLLDAQPGAAYNNRPVDHYMYTLESFQEARRLLATNGVLLVNFAPRGHWFGDRFQGLLAQVFGRPPLVFYMGFKGSAEYGAPGELTLVTGNGLPTWQDLPLTLEGDYLRSCQVTNFPGTTRLTTDDWPYLYLEHAKIPRLHWLTALGILGAVVALRRRILTGPTRLDWHYFFLGAAFLLLEVQTVSRATLLFGMTWMVNSIVTSAVLVMILLANFVAARWPKRPVWAVNAGLAITVAALALIPLDWFNALTGATKLIAASAFLTAPVFFAGLIFIRSFAECQDKAPALGANLIGALAGGLLESLAFVTGVRALMGLVGLFYLLAMLIHPRTGANRS